MRVWGGRFELDLVIWFIWLFGCLLHYAECGRKLQLQRRFRQLVMSAPLAGAGCLLNSTSTAFRPALRACGRPTFVSRDKSRQKRFLQAAAVRGAGRRGPGGFGVWHRALLRDLLVRAEWSLGLRVPNGSRLRWLSERGRIDCACTVLLGMLKRVPVRGGEGWWWPGCGRRSCPAAGMVTMLEVSCRRDLQAATGAGFIGAGCASHRKRRVGITRRAARIRKLPAAGCRSREADRATQPTHHPNLEPSSASTDDHDALDRGDPAPINIEAGIHSPPANQGAHDDRAKRSPAKAAIKHLTTIPINAQRSPLPPVKSAFAYFPPALLTTCSSRGVARSRRWGALRPSAPQAYPSVR